MDETAAARESYNSGVEAAAAYFDRLAAEAEALIAFAFPGAQVQEFTGRMLALRLHAAAVRKLKQPSPAP
jgi:hypothetical protein